MDEQRSDRTGMQGSGESEFEASLAKALRPVEAPPGFGDRVMARAESQQAKAVRGRVIPMARWSAQRSWRAWAAAAAAAVIALGCFGAERVHERREQERAAVVQQEFDAALKATSEALAQTREQLARAGVRLSELPMQDPEVQE